MITGEKKVQRTGIENYRIITVRCTFLCNIEYFSTIINATLSLTDLNIKTQS